MSTDFKYSRVIPGFTNLFTFYIVLKATTDIEEKKFLIKNIINGFIINMDYIEEKAKLYLPGIDFKSLISFLDKIDNKYSLMTLLDEHIKTFGYPPITNWDVNLHPHLRNKIVVELNIINDSPKWVPFFRDHALNQILIK